MESKVFRIFPIHYLSEGSGCKGKMLELNGLNS